MTWVQLKGFFDSSQFLVWDFTFTIEIIFTSTFSLNYDIYVRTYPHKFRRYWQCTVFFRSDECKGFIPIPQCSDKEIDYVNMRPLAPGWKPKCIWSRRTYSHKNLGQSTDNFKVEGGKIDFKHESKRNFWDTDNWTSGNFSCIGQ